MIGVVGGVLGTTAAKEMADAKNTANSIKGNIQGITKNATKASKQNKMLKKAGISTLLHQYGMGGSDIQSVKRSKPSNIDNKIITKMGLNKSDLK